MMGSKTVFYGQDLVDLRKLMKLFNSLSIMHGCLMDKEKKEQLMAYWLEGAQRDFTAATDIISQTKQYGSGLFFLHLSVEKTLKALCVKRTDGHAPFSHNLLHLAAKCGLQPTVEQESHLAEINEFNLESRYPDEKFSLEKRATKEFAALYLKNTGDLRKWILSILNS